MLLIVDFFVCWLLTAGKAGMHICLWLSWKEPGVHFDFSLEQFPRQKKASSNHEQIRPNMTTCPFVDHCQRCLKTCVQTGCRHQENHHVDVVFDRACNQQAIQGHVRNICVYEPGVSKSFVLQGSYGLIFLTFI